MWLWLFMLVGCRGGGEAESAETAVPQEKTQLLCTDSCKDQGQCGTLLDTTIVVFAHNDQPATRDHNLFFPHESVTLAIDAQERLVQKADGSQETVLFRRVSTEDGSKSGWVANWCMQPVSP